MTEADVLTWFKGKPCGCERFPNGTPQKVLTMRQSVFEGTHDRAKCDMKCMVCKIVHVGTVLKKRNSNA